MSKIIVIGANHAGTACINTMLDHYPGQNEVVVYDSNSNISFLGCGMALWIGKQIAGGEGLFYSDAATLEAKGAKIFMEHRVESVDYEKRRIKVKDLKTGREFEDGFDKLIIATGSKPIIPSVSGTDLENVQQVKLYQNAQEVIDKLERPEIKKVAVVGAGYIGVELAEAFERCGKEVTLIDLAPTCLASYYDEEFSKLMEETLTKHGIKQVYKEQVKEIRGRERVESILTDKGEYPTDMAILCIGFRPNIALAEGLEKFKNGAILVDRHQESSVSGVYAIGDCATVYDNASGERQYIALATNAVRSGIIAAHNACGTEIETVGVQGSNGINIYELKMVSTGMSEAKALSLGYSVKTSFVEDLQKPEFMEHDNHKVKIKLVYDAKTRVILGAQIASEHDVSMAIHFFSLAVQEKITVDKLALTDIFFLPHFNKPYNYITMAALGAK
ncbi:MAG: FAD-dependent oxidoreductase [Johnsonella sp.]|nr:FAD-dependent oxidoreductase [Johnsonella sp.]